MRAQALRLVEHLRHRLAVVVGRARTSRKSALANTPMRPPLFAAAASCISSMLRGGPGIHARQVDAAVDAPFVHQAHRARDAVGRDVHVHVDARQAAWRPARRGRAGASRRRCARGRRGRRRRAVGSRLAAADRRAPRHAPPSASAGAHRERNPEQRCRRPQHEPYGVSAAGGGSVLAGSVAGAAGLSGFLVAAALGLAAPRPPPCAA